MRIAIKRDATIVDEGGRVTGHDAGATLVRRLLRLFPDSMLVGPGARRCEGFDLVPLEFIDPQETVLVNMDVVDSLGVWNTLFHSSGGAHPRIMNFVWWPTSSLVEEVQVSSFALSCALFPTFANSERTATEVRETVAKWTVARLAEKAKLSWVNLGFRLEHVRERVEPKVPVVLYPAIYLSERKRPQEFMAIVDEVHRRLPIMVEMRLHESHLVSEPAMEISRRNWVWVGPLTASRTSYWQALAHTTAFVATATEESYGLSYVEAMGAGAIGILPDRPWARALVPDGYPFLYETREDAVALLERAVAEPAACRRALDELVGGSFQEWIQHRHSDDAFDREIREHVRQWFGD
ncbi:MAG: glycosyltransferase family 1 protein [Propionibacterium sp.]|nr:glycosyltransferase family 1 protein [Propionibacterium sp.]MDN6566098.1 glycosyltransferase family 1 protein [Actinomyces sp.]MDN6794127.1 glycosyltransferase family 1 protein [Propionibacterium sp.]